MTQEGDHGGEPGYGVTMADSPQWYDSIWLDKYLAAKAIVARVAPERLTEFVESFSALRTHPDFTVKRLPQLFDAETLAAIRQARHKLDPAKLELHEARRFGRFIVHDLPEFTRLQHQLTELVSQAAGEAVEPSYNFLSLYTKMGVCEPHLDAPSAKWTLDICIDQSEPWPIHLSQIIPWPEAFADLGDDWQASIKADPQLNFSTEVLMPGDAILFSGSSQWHYRDPLPQGEGKRFCDLLFLHYIPKGAGEIVRPDKWAKHFGIPELAQSTRVRAAQ